MQHVVVTLPLCLVLLTMRRCLLVLDPRSYRMRLLYSVRAASSVGRAHNRTETTKGRVLSSLGMGMVLKTILLSQH